MPETGTERASFLAQRDEEELKLPVAHAGGSGKYHQSSRFCRAATVK